MLIPAPVDAPTENTRVSTVDNSDLGRSSTKAKKTRKRTLEEAGKRKGKKLYSEEKMKRGKVCRKGKKRRGNKREKEEQVEEGEK